MQGRQIAHPLRAHRCKRARHSKQATYPALRAAPPTTAAQLALHRAARAGAAARPARRDPSAAAPRARGAPRGGGARAQPSVRCCTLSCSTASGLARSTRGRQPPRSSLDSRCPLSSPVSGTTGRQSQLHISIVSLSGECINTCARAQGRTSQRARLLQQCRQRCSNLLVRATPAWGGQAVQLPASTPCRAYEAPHTAVPRHNAPGMAAAVCTKTLHM